MKFSLNATGYCITTNNKDMPYSDFYNYINELDIFTDETATSFLGADSSYVFLTNEKFTDINIGHPILFETACDLNIMTRAVLQFPENLLNGNFLETVPYSHLTYLINEKVRGIFGVIDIPDYSKIIRPIIFSGNSIIDKEFIIGFLVDEIPYPILNEGIKLFPDSIEKCIITDGVIIEVL